MRKDRTNCDKTNRRRRKKRETKHWKTLMDDCKNHVMRLRVQQPQKSKASSANRWETQLLFGSAETKRNYHSQSRIVNTSGKKHKKYAIRVIRLSSFRSRALFSILWIRIFLLLKIRGLKEFVGRALANENETPWDRKKDAFAFISIMLSFFCRTHIHTLIVHNFPTLANIWLLPCRLFIAFCICLWPFLPLFLLLLLSAI